MIKHSYFVLQKNNYPQDIVLSDQTHSDVVNIVNSVTDKHAGDALVTTKKNLKIGVLTADCLPIIYFDKTNKVIAISHNGWRGISNNLIKNTLKEMQNLGADINKIECHIGMGIGTCCYKIYGERLKIFRDRFSEVETQIIIKEHDETYLNLKSCAKHKLLQHGVLSKNISVDVSCTSCNKDLPSFRRDGHANLQILTYISM